MRIFFVWRDCWHLLVGGLVVVVFGLLMGLLELAWLGMVWIVAVVLFFRDFERQVVQDERAVLAPADGKVVAIVEEQEPNFLKGPARRVSIFLSIFDVHVQRSPLASRVEWCHYTPGKFHTAWKEEASIENERNGVGFRRGAVNILVYQVAGLIARRIVNWVKPGDEVGAGQRFGLIKFGSRVDVFMPLSVNVSVKVGDRVRGGLDVLGSLAS